MLTLCDVTQGLESVDEESLDMRSLLLVSCMHSIDKDLLRTMPQNSAFLSKESEGAVMLRRILIAFCVRNPNVCQQPCSFEDDGTP